VLEGSLEPAANPNEILIGDATFSIVESVVDAQEIAPLTLRGKAQPVRAYRLVGVLGIPARRNEAPMVRRATELRRLADAYDQAVRDRSCQLFTVLGTAGVDKSRLVHEFLECTDATVVSGFCLSYGDGITYSPVIDVVRQVVQQRPEIKLSDDLASMLGQESFTAPSSQNSNPGCDISLPLIS